MLDKRFTRFAFTRRKSRINRCLLFKILVATASLELGIDIGEVDLVCQIASTRAVAVAMQRVGRAGHWRGAIPKGRLFATTRDDLLEQAALVRKMRAGVLDQLEIPPHPIDVLMQQMVAACGAESWDKDSLYEVFRRAYSYRDLTREHFEELAAILCNGIESSRGRYGAYHDLDAWRGYVSAAGFVELEHYYRPTGLPREQQPWLASVWRRSTPG